MRNSILVTLLLVSSIFAHGAHTLNTTISFQKNSLSEPLTAHSAEIEMQLTWQQITEVIKQASGKSINEPDSISLYDSILFKTISAQTVLLNGTDTAKAEQLPFPTVSNEDLHLGKGLFYRIRYISQAPFDSVHYSCSVLGKDSHYQNHVVVMSADSYPLTDTNIRDPKEVFSFSLGEMAPTFDSSKIDTSKELRSSGKTAVSVLLIALVLLFRAIVLKMFRKNKNQ